MERNTMKRSMPLVVMLLILFLAYGADRLLEAAEARASETFIRTPIVWLNAVILIVFAIVMLGLAWFTIIRQKMNRSVSWIFLVVGCLIMFLNPIQFSIGISVLPIWFSKLTSNSFLIQAGAFIAVMGFAGLLARRFGLHVGL